MQLPIFSIEGKPTGAYLTVPEVLLQFEPNEHLIYLDVKRILADRRQGTHKTKTRGEVKGSKRKLYRQKGTGRARMGSIRNPIRRGGGTVHGPVPRDYSIKLNAKEKQLARLSAFVLHLRNQSIWVVDSFAGLAQPKTKLFLRTLEGLGWDRTPLQVYTHGYNPIVYLSGRNIPKVYIQPAQNWNTYDIARARHLLWEQAALENLFNQLAV
ncbi:MAG: 50S ribosomal protein L4 [Bacteroidia bacterium]|nr:50S ribosomal protein L4 [Bacteroidia bacterium]MCX7764857.1 50S ribosomal protein L4 [Bacteroidia bacterium]MDW8057174.1 50S ribosomal protein L4 [Bacteroidia bacterium]